MNEPATLPNPLVIGGITHVLHWRTKNHAVLQSYTLPAPTSNDPLANPLPQIIGTNMFHVFQIVNTNPGESLGDKLASFTDLQAAMNFVAKEEHFA
jgi:hypothetical protein